MKNNGCIGKMPFISQAEARAYIKHLKFKSNKLKQVKRIYHCNETSTFPFDHWHTTSMSKNKFKNNL